MTIDGLKAVLETISNEGNGHLPVAFFANNHRCMSDEVNGDSTVTLCEIGRVDPHKRSYQKKFVLIGNYQGSGRGFTELLQY